jgi:molybdate transport system substrate-binding protein
MRIFVVAVLMLPAVAAAKGDEIRVGAASSLRDVMIDIAKAYKQKTKDDVKFTFGASGQLVTQIRGGARIDLFVSANHTQVDALTKEKLADASTAKVVAHNRLVVVLPAGSKLEIKKLADLAGAEVKRLAIAEPGSVAAGEYAAQMLALEKIDGAVKDRLVLGADVRQVLKIVVDSQAEAGIVYATDAKIAGDKVKVALTVDENKHAAIEYPAVVISESKQPAKAKEFLEYLGSEAAAKIFAEHGFVAK